MDWQLLGSVKIIKWNQRFHRAIPHWTVDCESSMGYKQILEQQDLRCLFINSYYNLKWEGSYLKIRSQILLILVWRNQYWETARHIKRTKQNPRTDYYNSWFWVKEKWYALSPKRKQCLQNRKKIFGTLRLVNRSSQEEILLSFIVSKHYFLPSAPR